MAGFMDYFTGGTGGTGFDMFGGDASGVNDLLTAQQQEAIKRQSMLAMAAQLLQAGGRSTQRTSLGQALGQGVMAGQQAQEKGTTGAVNQMLLRSKLDEAKRAQTLQGKISDIFATAPMTQQDAALAAPESVAGAPGPTVRRLELSATINPKLAQAETYRRAAAASATDPAKAKTYMDIADQLDPRQEVTGQPFQGQDGKFYIQTKSGGVIPAPVAPAAKPVGQQQQVMGPNGKPVQIQNYDDGSYRVVSGISPLIAPEKIDTGSGIMFRDPYSIPSGTVFPKGLAPQVVGGAESGYFVLGGGGGGGGMPRLPATRPTAGPVAGPIAGSMAGPAAEPTTGPVPIIPGTGKEAPAEFTKTVRKLNDLKGNLLAYKKEIESDKAVFPSSIPLPFGAGAIPLPTGQDTARVRGKYQSLLMGVKDLYDLGALTGPDMGIIEQQLTNPASFSGAFTSRAAMGEQIKVLEDMIARSEENITSSYKRKIPAASTATAQPAGALHPTDIQSIINSFNANRSR
ncbi:hypothetical protein [Caudoviricetes sp.]|nr:hypothetical protein [Caudoviricetes sp.]